MKLYCPSCGEVYAVPKEQRAASRLDGAFFGTTFPHLLVMQFNLLKMKKKSYVPRIFGFRVHKSARNYHDGSIDSNLAHLTSADRVHSTAARHLNDFSKNARKTISGLKKRIRQLQDDKKRLLSGTCGMTPLHIQQRLYL